MSLSAKPDGVRSWVARLLREPLVHFIAIGAVVFLFLHAMSPRADNSSASDEIVVSPDDLSRLAVAWQAQRGSLPTAQDLAALADEDVREEVLAREAVSLGLDRGDPIIRRRLAQKMDFLAADIATLQDPSETQLRSWYKANSARFVIPQHASFHHLYFSFDRGPRAHDDAAAALRKVSAAGTEPAQAGADPFMFRDFYSEKTPEQVTREFGAEFSTALFQLKPAAWSEPIRSGYGWHLVYIEALEPSRIPHFEEVAPDVKQAWLDEKQRLLRDKAYETMREHYKIVLPHIPVGKLVSQKIPAVSQDVLAPQ